MADDLVSTDTPRHDRAVAHVKLTRLMRHAMLATLLGPWRPVLAYTGIDLLVMTHGQ
jgi:hypothetical protein